MSLYAKTDMQHAVEDLDQLTEIMSRGGIPMQQAVATMLTQAGQYIRREKSFEGATVDTVPAPVDMKGRRTDGGHHGPGIMAFDTAREGDIKNIEKQLAGSGEAVLADGSIGKQGMHSTGFSSIMHNLIGQYTLSMKADAAVEAAAKAVERGEKPSLPWRIRWGLSSANAPAPTGEGRRAVDLSWKDMFLRYLDKTRTITVDKPGSKEKDSIYLSDDQLSPEALRAYNEARTPIEKADFSNLPVSPIDRVLNGLRERGIRADEITGRTDAIDYSDGQQKYRKREATSSNNVDVVSRFNGGELDALIINQSGSTGISLHASENFADQKSGT